MNKKENKLDQKNKLKILEEVKKIVRVKGWSSDILSKIKLPSIDHDKIRVLFPNGNKDLLQLVFRQINTSLEIKLKKININHLSLNKRIKKILNLRFKILDSDKKFYTKTFNHMLLPNNSKIMKKSLYKSIDHMWYLAGDTSTDFNFYTKRIILASIYVNALFIFFNKTLDDVEVNIDKNLMRVSKIPKFKNKLNLLGDSLPIFIRGIFN